MSASRPSIWEINTPTQIAMPIDVSTIEEDDAVSRSERVRARLEGWDPGTLTWKRVQVDSDGIVQVSGSGGGGGAVTQGTTPWVVGDGGGSLTVDGTVTANAGTGPWPVTDNAGSLTVDAPVGTPVYVRLSDGASALVGQKAMAASVPVVVASDQTTLMIGGEVAQVDPSDLAAALNSTIEINTDGADFATFHIGASVTGAVIFEVTADGSYWTSEYAPAFAYIPTILVGTDLTGSNYTNPTSGTFVRVFCAGMRQVRIRVASVLSAPLPTKITTHIGATPFQPTGGGGFTFGLNQHENVTSLGDADSNSSIVLNTRSDAGIFVYSVASAGRYFNGSSWDRVRGSTTGAWVQGNLASDAPMTARPLPGGGRASTATPTAVSGDGDVVALWLTRSGATVVDDGAGSLTVDAPVATPVFVRLSDGSSALVGQKTMANSLPVVIASDQGALTVDTELPAAATLDDSSLTAPSAPAVASLLMGYNATRAEWERLRVEDTGILDVDLTGDALAHLAAIRGALNDLAFQSILDAERSLFQ